MLGLPPHSGKFLAHCMSAAHSLDLPHPLCLPPPSHGAMGHASISTCGDDGSAPLWEALGSQARLCPLPGSSSARSHASRSDNAATHLPGFTGHLRLEALALLGESSCAALPPAGHFPQQQPVFLPLDLSCSHPSFSSAPPPRIGCLSPGIQRLHPAPPASDRLQQSAPPEGPPLGSPAQPPLSENDCGVIWGSNFCTVSTDDRILTVVKSALLQLGVVPGVAPSSSPGLGFHLGGPL